MAVRRPHPPKLSASRRPVDAADIVGSVDGDEEFDGLDVTGDAPPIVVHGFELTASTVIGARLTGIEAVESRWRDVSFERVDLSGAMLEGARLQRCSFVDCRLSGIVLSSARLRDVSFVRCRLDQVSLRMVDGERVRFDECDLAGADLYDAKLAEAQILGSRLVGADLSGATLTGAELHGSDVSDLRGAMSLRGVVIGPDDAVAIGLALLGAFGVRLSDEPTG